MSGPCCSKPDGLPCKISPPDTLRKAEEDVKGKEMVVMEGREGNKF